METRAFGLIPWLVLATASAVAADPGDSSTERAVRRERASTPRLGIALRADVLGAGADVAVAISRTVNLRAGVRALELEQDYRVDGLDLDGTVTLRSASAYLDWFPFGGAFHLSPGAMLYNGNGVRARANVGAGQPFTVGGVELTSSVMDPVSGSATVDFARVAPALVLGWGNLVPRGGGRWSVPFELGVVYAGSPTTTLALVGTACDADGDCRDLRDPTLQALVRAEEARLDQRLAPFKVLPVVSLGLGYRF